MSASDNLKQSNQQLIIPSKETPHLLVKPKTIWSNSMKTSDLNGSKLVEVEGIKCLMVDKQCMTDEEGMRDLISLLQKNKSKIEGIVITDFEGSFKIDYFKRIELSLREINKLKTIIINNSNLTREHIQILRNIIWWRREQIEKILLSKNSMDSLDFNDLFVQDDFNVRDIKNLRTLEIRVQPGINKLTKTQLGEFTDLLVKQNESTQKKKENGEKQVENRSLQQQQQLYISLDETSLNHKNKEVILNRSTTLSSLHLDNTYTNDKLLFSLNLGGCFQDRNESALRYFGEYLLAENFDDIVSLSFAKTQLKNIDNWVPVFTFLKKTKSILDLDLSDCSLIDTVLIQLFSHNLAIKSLDLSNNNGINLEGWKKMTESVICNPKSVTDILKLNNCYFKESEIEDLSKMIMNFATKMQKSPLYLCALQKLYLNQNHQVSAKGLQSLMSSIFTLAKQSLETIEFRDCQLNSDKLAGILRAMESSFSDKGNQLDEMVLRNNPSLGEAQIQLQKLLQFLMSSKVRMKRIDISNCGVISSTIKLLSDSYLRSHKSLQKLVIKNNPLIDAAGYSAIAEYFLFSDSTPSLNQLDISNNSLTAEKLSGFLEIAEKFNASTKINNKFKRLQFNQNNTLEANCFDRICRLFFFSPSMRIQKLSLKNSLNDVKVTLLGEFIQKAIKDTTSMPNYSFQYLEGISLDKNNLLSIESLVELIEIFLIQNYGSIVFPKLSQVKLSYCNICDPHAKELLTRTLKNNGTIPKSPTQQVRALKSLNLEGNTCLTSNGWMMIAHLIFQSGYFDNLEKLDLTYCKLEETGVSQICTQFQLSLKDKGSSFKHPLKELILNKNSLLESSDFITIFDAFVFSPNSYITKLSIANSGVDSTAMQYLIKGTLQHIKNETGKGFFDNNRLPLIDLNLSGNDTIDDVTWKLFMKAFILNKPDTEPSSEIETMIKEEKLDKKNVGTQFKQIVEIYKEKINRLKIPNKIPVFTIQELNLRGTTALESNRWVEIFSKLIITKQSQLRKLSLSSTYIEKKGWADILETIKDFETKEKGSTSQLLRLTDLDFSENFYLEPAQWQSVSENLFFNTTLVQLEKLNLSLCRITQPILGNIFEGVGTKKKPLPNLAELNLNRNNLTSLEQLEQSKFPKLKQLSFTLNQIPVDKLGNEALQNQLSNIALTLDSNEMKDNLTNLFKELLDGFPKLECLTLRGFQPLFSTEFNTIFQMIKSRKLSSIDFTSQKIQEDDLFNAILEANTFTKTFNFTSGFMIQEKLPVDENEQKEQIQKLNAILDSKTKDTVSAIALKKVHPKLQNLDLSSLYGDESEKRESIVIHKLMIFIGKCCSAIVKLQLKKCLIQDQSFMSFCNEYAVNTQFKLQEISLANNTQYTNAAWGSFFEHVLLASNKNSLRSVDISGNSFNLETFEILSEKAKRMKGKIELERLYIENIHNIPVLAWTQHFFQGFVMLDSVKIKYLYIDRSLSIDSSNAVYAVIKTHTEDPSCSLINVFGYFDIEQLFYSLHETEKRTINLKTNLEQSSQLTVRDLWKKGLVNPSVTSIDCDSSLSEDFVNAIPEMTLDFIQDLLQPLNESLQLTIQGNNNNKKNKVASAQGQNTPQILCLDYETITSLQRYFNLASDEQSQDNSKDKLKNGAQQPSLAYPYNLILQPRFSNFLLKKTVFTHIYFMQHRFFDVIDTRQIYNLYLQLKDTKIDSIIIDYDLRQVDLPENLTEEGLISLIRLFPPKSLGLDNVSINALKAIYSILASNSNFRYANVNFSSNSFINNGIAFSLREQLFTGKKRRNLIIRAFGSIAYSFLDLFCVEAEVYKFDEQIPILNEKLKQNRFYFNLMILLTYIYFAICIVVPYMFTLYDGNYEDKSTGIANISHIIYGIFAFVSMIAEIVIYKFASSNIKHHLQMLIKVDNIDDSETSSIMDKVKSFFKNRTKLLEWISFIFSLLISQVDRFDLYSDVCFIVICFKQDFFTIGLISLAIIASQLSSNILKLFSLQMRVLFRGSKRLLNTHEINQFCEISNLLEFEALNDILDTVAPYNISFIPNNFLFRFIMPSAAGQSISNRLFVSMQKFLLEDAIQIVIQVAFVIQQDQGDSTVIISIITSVVSILKAFYKFMSIRPSTTSQLDFDSLSKLKLEEAKQQRIKNTQNRDNMLSNIKIAVEQYSPSTNITIQDYKTIQREEEHPLKSPKEHLILTPKKA